MKCYTIGFLVPYGHKEKRFLHHTLSFKTRKNNGGGIGKETSDTQVYSCNFRHGRTSSWYDVS